jgi:hypothetical protein
MFAYLNAQLPSKLFGEIKWIADDASDLKKKVQLDRKRTANRIPADQAA